MNNSIGVLLLSMKLIVHCHMRSCMKLVHQLLMGGLSFFDTARRVPTH